MATSSLNLSKSMKGTTNEHLRRVYNTGNQGSTIQKKRGSVKKHNCLNSVARSEICIGSKNSTSRPVTRRSTPQSQSKAVSERTTGLSDITPHNDADNMLRFLQKKRPLRNRRDRSASQSIQEPQNSVPVSRRGSEPNSSRQTVSSASPIGNIAESDAADRLYSDEVSTQAESKNNKTCVLPDSEEHEYLLFLLRITEDIISQDFYSNSDIKKIFKSHVDLNKNRLNQRKMYQHINNLCKELNIDCKDYETPDTSLAPMQMTLQTTPRKHRHVFNNESFKNCRECSTLRASSFNHLHNAFEEFHTLSDKSIRDSSSISPSLIKLLEKLSLSRVTECTESVSSCTPITSNAVIQSPKRDINYDKGPIDFETFVKELKEQKTIKEGTTKTPDFIESAPSATDAVSLQVIKDSANLEITKYPEQLEQIASATAAADSKTDLETSEKEAVSSMTVSEKYESEFEKCSSSVESEKIQEGISVNSKHSQVDLEVKPEENNDPTLVPPLELNQEANSSDEILSSKNSTARQVELLEGEKSNFVPTKCDDVIVEIPQSQDSNTKSKILTAKSSTSSTEDPKNIYKELEENFCPLKTEEKLCTSPKDSAVIETPKADKIKKKLKSTTLSHSPSSDKSNAKYASPESPLKIILHNKIREEDYVMVKGPLYVYKPLLETEPKLIIFPEGKQENRLASPPVSEKSHNTFTVENPPDYQSIDEGVQYNTSLHSIHVNHTLEHILELTRRAYTQFNDLKLLQGDYDLTPEKDDSGKYHNLLVDVGTTVSGQNMTDNLLLSDDYLTNRSRVVEEHKIPELGRGDTIDEYARFEQRLLDSNYVINNRNLSSRSVPKLRLNSGKLISNSNIADNQDIVYKVSSDLIKFDDSPASQDSSSIRSEGEAQIIEGSNSDLHWDLFNL
ncbi:uncharacterized protein LOC126735552 [Anthonomus grandis grandis]|uniref:uncharacterized protein LOC126735552 n=1 Tax=Anthonomus grandis grandis TaxID=2921223 RepID=UPI0021655C9F|nr:uncharacterized protein LOC126735552 [Anthonomus grandis grandis]